MIDRQWINHNGVRDRRKPEYLKGVNKFLDFAFENTGGREQIRCPCVNCVNSIFQNRDTVFYHLMFHGILKSYTRWDLHGEKIEYHRGSEKLDDNEDRMDFDETIPLVHDATNVPFNMREHDSQPHANVHIENGEIPKTFTRLMKDAEQELFPCCTSFSKLEFIVHLIHLKTVNNWSDKSFTGLLELLQRAFLQDEKFPKNAYEAKKYTRDLGLNYIKIDVCKNDCILYRKQYANHQSCPICGCSRWKTINSRGESSVRGMVGKGKQVSEKVLRHFSIILRLQRLYMSSKIASHMWWHKEKRLDDGILRHPADSKAWKMLDTQYSDFALDARNVRLGLASDGFNPFRNMGISYSIWPVVLVPYNLPPWMSMKSDFFMLTLLIPGPKAPGNGIDVYLEPFIDEIKELWNVGVETYNSYSSSIFKLRAALLWTISDFPAYANLSGWSTRGELACPICNIDTCSRYLKHGHKYCYMGHRRFLDVSHKWRFDKKNFDDTIENSPAPKPLSACDILHQLHGCENVILGKSSGKRKRHDETLPYNYKKKSIFWRLPYWDKLLIRHNLDMMHIEKNVCDNIKGMVMGLARKNKDNVKARMDLEEIGIHKDLHLIDIGGRYKMPLATYALTLKEKRQVCEILSLLKVSDGYSSNLARCVNRMEGKISGLKSHDCHVFMQDLIPATFRGILQKDVYEPLVEMGLFFKQLCGKALKMEILRCLEKSIKLTLCKLERIFPPSFFDIMIHLTVHLVSEAIMAGPVQYRWMYSFERCVHTYSFQA